MVSKFQPVKNALRADRGGAEPTNVPHDDEQTPPPLSTRSTLTILTNESKVPMSVIKAEVRQRQIVDQMGTACIQHPLVFEYAIAEGRRDATTFAALTRHTLHCRSR